MFNSKFKLAKIILLSGILAIFADTAFAQNLETLAELINRGNSEQKRNALAQIRNLESAEASRLAIPALRDSDIMVRATAPFSVIYLPKDEAAQVLLPLLHDRAELVRRETAYALGKVVNPLAVNPLLQIIQKDKILEVRGAAVVALGEIGDVSAVNSLLQIVRRKPRSEEEFMRRAAAKSIGQIAQIAQFQKPEVNAPTSFLPDKLKVFQYPRYEFLSKNFPVFIEATSLLINTLQNPNEFADVKREAAFALGAIGSPSALPSLRANFANEDYYLAEICREAAIKISNANEKQNLQ